jgi:hypothetical protein
MASFLSKRKSNGVEATNINLKFQSPQHTKKYNPKTQNKSNLNKERTTG